MDRQFEKYRHPISSAIEAESYDPVTSPHSFVRGNHVMKGYSNFDFSEKPSGEYGFFGVFEPCNGAGVIATDSRLKGKK